MKVCETEQVQPANPPPSITRVVPVTKVESSLAKDRTFNPSSHSSILPFARKMLCLKLPGEPE